MDHKIAIAQNVATNGRWFCASLVLINIAAQHYGIAIFAAFPMGLAAIVDLLPPAIARPASVAVYGFTVCVALASLLAIG